MRVLAVDPGYERLGVAVLERLEKKPESLLFSHCYTTPSSETYPDRLVTLGKEIEHIIHVYKPGAFALETIFLTKNQKTAMRVSGARGALLYIARKEGLTIYEYSPLQVKTAVTGYGKSDKKQMISMVTQLIALPQKQLRLDDEYDAIAIGVTHFALEKTWNEHPVT
jgi:crossover junction endodeoxyribonuclease RuvC